MRVVDRTASASIPPLVADRDTPPEVLARLRAAFAAFGAGDGDAAIGQALDIDGFAPPSAADYSLHARWADEAEAENYPAPG